MTLRRNKIKIMEFWMQMHSPSYWYVRFIACVLLKIKYISQYRRYQGAKTGLLSGWKRKDDMVKDNFKSSDNSRAQDLVCLFLHTDSDFCCMPWLGFYAFIHLISHGNTVRMFNAFYLRVSWGLAAMKGWASTQLCALWAPQNHSQPQASVSRDIPMPGAGQIPESKALQSSPLSDTQAAMTTAGGRWK